MLGRNRRIAEGEPADLTLFSTEHAWTFRASESASKSRNSPFDGREFRGAPMATIVAGRIVYRAGSLTAQRSNAHSQATAKNLFGRKKQEGTAPLPHAGFGGGMHAVLGHFVDAAQRRFVVRAVEMIERAGALADANPFSMALVT